MQLLLKRSSGHDWGPMILDPLAWVYIVVAVLSTVALCVGISCIIFYRHLDCVRIRNIALMTASLVVIQVYLMIVLLNYPLNGDWPCSAGYWVMGFYLPIVVALFQAQNIQLLSLSALQKELTFDPPKLRKRPWWCSVVRFQVRWRDSNLLDRMYLSLGVGFFLQVRPPERLEIFNPNQILTISKSKLFLVLFVYLASRKFHTFGFIGKDEGNTGDCRRGWEWSVQRVLVRWNRL